MGTLVAINRCYGGFGLSKKAMEMISKIKGRKIDSFEYGIADYDDCSCRIDKDLISVVKELGEEANDRFADITLEDIGDSKKFRIREYDGLEWVETPESVAWTEVKEE